VLATRRGFLRLAGGSAALCTLAQLRALPARAAGGSTGPGFFAPREREILAAVGERMVETGVPGAPAFAETGALDVIDALCAGLDPSATAPLPALLRLVEWGPLLFEGRVSRFTQLGPEERDAHLAGWMHSRFGVRRMGFYALRNLSMLATGARRRPGP
jgi:hypothetical protein